MPRAPRAIVLLGAQRFDPTLGAAVAAFNIDGPVATVTAGWQERESDDQDLHEHLGRRTVNLHLYERADDVFRSDPELHAAHRKRQEVMRHKQDFYRIRLEHELDAAQVIRTRAAPPEILAEEHAASIESIRELDRWHLGQCARVRDEFDAAWRPFERRAVARHRREIEQVLAGCQALAIAGGHVAVLLNRLMFFGIGELLDGHVVFAWTAGAMALCDRVVLYHDAPPQGPGAAEVLDRGLGLEPAMDLGSSLLRQRRYDDAEALFKELAKSEGSGPDPLSPSLCRSLMGSGKKASWRAGVAKRSPWAKRQGPPAARLLLPRLTAPDRASNNVALRARRPRRDLHRGAHADLEGRGGPGCLLRSRVLPATLSDVDESPRTAKTESTRTGSCAPRTAYSIDPLQLAHHRASERRDGWICSRHRAPSSRPRTRPKASRSSARR